MARPPRSRRRESSDQQGRHVETPERNDKQPEGVSAGSGLESMIPASAKHQFASVLKAEQLVEVPSCFRDPTFFDEVPLYSRYEQIDFLREYGEVDRLLLELSLEYLQRVKFAGAIGKSKRFIAIAIVRDDVHEPIVPYIFICNRNATRQLKNLHLSPPSKGLGKYIKSLMQKTSHPQEYRVLEDRTTVCDEVKVFISYKHPGQERSVSMRSRRTRQKPRPNGGEPSHPTACPCMLKGQGFSPEDYSMAARVVLAMSGGVDSSVAAYLLREQGYDVIGLFMRTGVHGRDDGRADHKKGCCSAIDAGDARRVADRLDIPFYALDFEKDFDRIIDYFADEYLAGRTPNPVRRLQ